MWLLGESPGGPPWGRALQGSGSRLRSFWPLGARNSPFGPLPIPFAAKETAKNPIITEPTPALTFPSGAHAIMLSEVA